MNNTVAISRAVSAPPRQTTSPSAPPAEESGPGLLFNTGEAVMVGGIEALAGGVPLGLGTLAYNSFASGHPAVGAACAVGAAATGLVGLVVIGMSAMISDSPKGGEALEAGMKAGTVAAVAATGLCALGTIPLWAAAAATLGVGGLVTGFLWHR